MLYSDAKIYLLDHLDCLTWRDFLIELFTETERTKAEPDLNGQAILPADAKIYIGKLFQIVGGIDLCFITEIVSKNQDKTYTVKYEQTRINGSSKLLSFQDRIKINFKQVANYLDKESVETNIGRIIWNHVVLVEPFGDMIPYINEQWNIDSIEKKIVDDILSKKINADQLRHYQRNAFFLGHFTDLSVPTFSEKSLTIDPAIIKRRDELFEQYANEIKAGDVVVMSKIENELIAMDKESLKGDVSMGFYGLSGKSFTNHRKVMFILGGILERFGEEGFDFVMNSLEEGMNPENFAILANQIRHGSYSRAKETAKGGEETKFLTRVFQNTRISEDDCGTTKYLNVYITEDMAKSYLYRNVLVNGRLVTITNDNISRFINTTVKMRSPHTCKTAEGYCYTCMGELFRTITQDMLAMTIIALSSSFTTSALKSMHGKSTSIVEIANLNKFVI